MRRLLIAGLGLALASACASACDGQTAASPSAPPPPPPEAVPLEATPAATADPPEPEPEPEPPAYALHKHDVERARQPIEDPSGSALDHFYDALAEIDREAGAPGELVRVVHWGDSAIGRDGFPDQIRARFWRRFGDGGPGFLMPEAFTGFYKPKSARLQDNGRWNHCYIAYGCRPDGHYGFGGVIFTSSGGAKTQISTTAQGSRRPWGRSWATAELWYAAFPKGGQLSLEIDGGEPVRLESDNPTWEDRWWSTKLEPGSHEFVLRARGFGRSRVYGAVFESEGPGVVWDAMPMSGAFTKRLLYWDAKHIRAQVERRKPDLIVFQYGGNDLKRIVTGTEPEKFRKELDEVLPMLRAGRPEASCLVIGISNHGRSGHFDVEPEHVEAIVGVQRAAAFAQGCAFFDSYAAMGGRGSLSEWRARGLLWGDLAHLSPRGHAEMAEILWSGLSAGYVAHRRGQDAEPLAEAPRPEAQPEAAP